MTLEKYAQDIVNVALEKRAQDIVNALKANHGAYVDTHNYKETPMVINKVIRVRDHRGHVYIAPCFVGNAFTVNQFTLEDGVVRLQAMARGGVVDARTVDLDKAIKTYNTNAKAHPWCSNDEIEEVIDVA